MSSHIQLPVTKNIKIHFRVRVVIPLNKTIADFLDLKVKNRFPATDTLDIKHNFCVFKRRFVYIIFFNTGYVNCTKIPNYSEISAAQEEFCQVFNLLSENLTTPIIDNTTCSGTFGQVIYLKKLKQEIVNQNWEEKNWCNVKFNPEHFPGLFIKTDNATIIVFHSGKYTIVGAKCQEEANLTFSQVRAFIHQ